MEQDSRRTSENTPDTSRWRCIVAGIDASRAGISAARAALDLAERIGADYHLIHARPEATNLPSHLPGTVNIRDLQRRLAETGAEPVRDALRDAFPYIQPPPLSIQIGDAPTVIRVEARRRGADVMVIGGKHHPPPVRWLGGSTAHELIHLIEGPLLVVAPVWRGIERVLVSAEAARGPEVVLRTARRLARWLGAKMVFVTPPGAEDPRATLGNGEGIAGPDGRVHTISADDVESESPTVLVTPFRRNVGGPGTRVDREAVALLNRLPTSMLYVPVTNRGAPRVPGTAR